MSLCACAGCCLGTVLGVCESFESGDETPIKCWRASLFGYICSFPMLGTCIRHCAAKLPRVTVPCVGDRRPSSFGHFYVHVGTLTASFSKIGTTVTSAGLWWLPAIQH
jgi:hypothetical protein